MMTRLGWLVSNEVYKMLRKRRFHVVLSILVVLMAVFSYAEQQAATAIAHQLGTSDWHVRLQEEVTNDVNHLNSPFLSSAEKSGIEAAIREGQYELSHNLNPYTPGAPNFMKTFMDEGMFLLIPMFVVIIAADIVSSEMSGGTIKVLLTRGVRRGEVLFSKLVALGLLTSILMTAIAAFGYVISGLFFGYVGFQLPVLFGFHVTASGYVSLSHVYTIPEWKYLLMSYGFGYVGCLATAALSFMVSTLVRSTASGIGIMMAALIAGALLSSLASNWALAKYLPVVNLSLSSYINGSPPAISGMTFTFSCWDLAISSILAIIVSFWVFLRRDVLS